MESPYNQSGTQRFIQPTWHDNMISDHFDDTSCAHNEVHEDDLVTLMNRSELSVDTNHVNALPQQSWYHGKIDRRIAAQRLKEINKSGCYLVRESDRQSDCYVLSFLSITSEISNFRIISVCGDFYMGGQQFNSLEQLVSYYTYRSYLLEGEYLKNPVSPPEPVDDRRRVQAVLPYQKVPDADNDELSFEKDDIFIVLNDMEGDWMWVTSQRTGESGCVFKGLVKELQKVVDPHEGKEWFHGNISMEQAYDLLSTLSEDGSFLIRKSDTTPGGYVLYFYHNHNIKRFKILRQSLDRFEMGRRSYESIDDIVDHYKQEQIVEGQTLVKAIPTTMSISQECDIDIYDTLTKATSADQLGSRAIINETGVLKKGQLLLKGTGKRGHDTKKWKSMFFVLHGKKQHLYYFEHEKKTKPKGLFDLGYGAVYPVHETYFGRPHCFQVVIRALNEVSSSYFYAESSDLAQVRSVHVTIEEAHKLSCRAGHRTYCTLSLNTVHVGRTKVKEGPEPVWNEEFIFDDIPPDVDSITISLHNAAKRGKQAVFGEVGIHFSKLSSGKFVDEWYNVVPSGGFGPGGSNLSSAGSTCGSVRVRAQYCNELIMPAGEYDLLKELATTDMKVICALAQICGQDRTILASVLLKIFQEQKNETELIRMLNEREINSKESEPETLFRATTLASTLMEQYMRTTCSSFVSLALKDVVKQITESKQSCELNPAKLQDNSEEDIGVNRETLLGYVRGILASILVSESIFPKGVRYVFGHLQHCVSQKWPDHPTVRIRVVSGFMFLRLICPAIVNPKMFNMISETPSSVASRNLLLVAKSIQNLANLVEFGAKEFYMECVNSFIVENKARIVNFIGELGNKNISLSSSRHINDRYKMDVTRDLASLFRICQEHLPELQALSNKEASLKKLLGVIELLNKQQIVHQQRLRQEL